jgi:hypothetical protein
MFRELIIDTALKVLKEFSYSNKLNAFEVGCSYTTKESKSTLRIPDFIQSNMLDGKFVSIEYDEEHILAAKGILRRQRPELLDFVQFVQGNSLVELPTILREFQTLNFAFLDGGVHPEVCLKEFELLIEYLSEDGLIVIDDVNQIFSLHMQRLIFGKSTLILPFLVINGYLVASRSSVQGHINDLYLGNDLQPNSRLVVADSAVTETLPEKKSNFVLVSEGGHSMLIVGGNTILTAFSSSLKMEIKRSYQVKMMLLKMRIEKILGMVFGSLPRVRLSSKCIELGYGGEKPLRLFQVALGS